MKPPVAADRLLTLFCPPHLLEAVQGDLHEEFALQVERLGERKARGWYWREVLGFLKPFALKRQPDAFSQPFFLPPAMIRHYFKMSLRQVAKNRLYSFINVFGLSVAVAFCLLIYLFVRHERGYDRFHAKADNLFVVTSTSSHSGSPRTSVYQPVPLSTALQADFPEIKRTVRFTSDEAVVTVGEKSFAEPVSFTDPGFFSLFSFALVQGSPTSALAQRNSVVLTTDLARKYFGTQNPLGKSLKISLFGNEESYLISGIAEVPPTNSSLTFNLLMRIEKRPFFERNQENWRAFSTPTFVEVAPGTRPEIVARKLSSFTKTRFAKLIELVRTRDKLPADAPVISLELLPLTALHLSPQVDWDGSSDPQYSYILGGVALLILLIACINYISLALTSASGRTLEVGIRKVTGATRLQLTAQLWGDSLLLAFAAMLLGGLLAELFLPLFNELTRKTLTISLAELLGVAGFLATIGLVISLVAGGYPALFLSSLLPVKIVQGRRTYRFKPGLIKGLVVVQYAVSVFLMVSALVMQRQMRFVTTKSLGYNQAQLLIISTFSGMSDDGDKLAGLLRNRLAGDPSVLKISATSVPPDNNDWSKQGYEVAGKEHGAFTYKVDYDFQQAMGLTLTQGRFFSPNFSTDTTDAIVVNEALVREYGWKNPIGQTLPWLDKNDPDRIIGVVKDYHNLSLESKIEPVILYARRYDAARHLVVRMAPGSVPVALEKVRSVWKEIAAGRPFDYYFQDERVARQYESYERWLKMASISTGMAILIACLGLFGLAGIMTLNRQKEIGIRKVMGASVGSLLVLLNRETVVLALISFVLAMPLAWQLMQKWLANFAYRTTLDGWVFGLAGLLSIGIALLTVSFQSVKAALMNPVKSLRSE